jgi:hypothetical protein
MLKAISEYKKVLIKHLQAIQIFLVRLFLLKAENYLAWSPVDLDLDTAQLKYTHVYYTGLY